MTRGAAGALVALSLAAFAFVTTEIAPIGLLPQIARSLGTSIALTGTLVTAYAFVVAVCAVPATALTARIPRRTLLLLLLATLSATNAAAALAGSYALLVAARIVNALAHAIFWSIVGSCAVRLVPERTRGLALAIVFAGPSLATVGGVPVATLVGLRFGWHAAFASIAGIAAVVFAIVAGTVTERSSAPSEPAAAGALLRDGAFRALLATTIFVVLGESVAYTYVVPYVVTVNGFAPAATASLLLLFGLAGAAGNIGAGALANRRPATASLLATATIASALVGLCWAGENRLLASVAIAIWGLGAGGLAVGLQTRVYALAPASPDVASAFFSAAFNIGIGGGALLGGLIIAELGVSRTAPVGATLAALAFVVLAQSVHGAQRSATSDQKLAKIRCKDNARRADR